MPKRYKAVDRVLEHVATAKADSEHAGDMLSTAVRDARLMGYTWAQIGDVLGISRQAAQQRFRVEE